MKQFLTILLLFVYSFSSIGATVKAHLCGGKVQKCFCSKSAKGKSLKKDTCCAEKTTFVKKQDLHQAAEFQAVKKITSWASDNGLIDKIEVLTFVDGETSVNWMIEAGAKVMNLLTKGSMNHLTHQLKKTPEQHFSEISKVITLTKVCSSTGRL